MKSDELFERAKAILPGGVNSPVRALKQVGAVPRYFERAEGPYLFDVEGKRYIDFCMAFGPHILGHSPQVVVDAIVRQAQRGTSYGACHRGEIDLAEWILRAYPFLDKVRLVNSGTEAVMTAIRIARGATGRPKIVKFEGCYHGHSDGLLAKGGSGLADLSEASSLGVPASIVSDTLIARYDDSALNQLFEQHPGSIAAVLFEPIPANHGLWIPSYSQIKRMVEICRAQGALTIFDEVISGFRFGLSGASGYFDLKADLVTLGKIIGGGLPLAAVAGTARLMDLLAPIGGVYQAGTLSGNPLGTAAGTAVLSTLFQNKAWYAQLDKRVEGFVNGLGSWMSDRGLGRVRSLNSVFWIQFGDASGEFPATLEAKSLEQYRTFFLRALDAGIYLPPSPYEVAFASFAHTPEVFDEAQEKLRQCM